MRHSQASSLQENEALKPFDINSLVGQKLEDRYQIMDIVGQGGMAVVYRGRRLADGAAVAIGGIKKKTDSDFSEGKAGVPDLAEAFDWELGYLYTEAEQCGRGIASTITRLLVDAYGHGNLMASTEIAANPAMVRILEKLGFRLYGKPWKSSIHDNYLGLFLKFQ